MTQPNLDEILGELDAGIFVQKIERALKESALGTIISGKKGNVTISLELEQVGDSSVNVKHTLKYTKPAKNGKLMEENTTQTHMYVDNFGYLTINTQMQDDIFKATETSGNITKIGSK